MSEEYSKSDKTWRKRFTKLLGLAALGWAIYSIGYFLKPISRVHFETEYFPKVIILFWTIGPPIWFFCEYFWLWKNADEKTQARIQVGQDLARPFWAAVLATLLFLLPK